MSSRSKKILIILIPILVVLGVMYSLINAVYVPAKEPIVYPNGSLQASIFVEQNNHYTENEQLKQEYIFQKVPYKANIPECDGAIIGDAATVYQINDKVFVYFSEYDDSMDVKQVILSQFPAAMLITYDPDRTTSLLQKDSTGYINGFAAEYLAMSIEATDGRSIVDAVVLGYALDVPGVDYAGKHIFVGIGTTELTTAAVDNCMQSLDMLMGTVRKDEKLEKDRKEEALAEAERLQGDVQLRADIPADVVQQSQQGIVGDETTTSINIDVTEDYQNMVVEVSWTEDNPSAVLELFTPDGNNYYSPSSQDGYTARFLVDYASAGSWQLRIMNYLNCGSISTFYSGDAVGGSTTGSGIDSVRSGEIGSQGDTGETGSVQEGGFIDD